MFGGKKKTNGIVAGSEPAQVLAEIPVLPKPSQPYRLSLAEEPAPVAVPAQRTSRGAVRQVAYVLAFSDGQQIAVGRRCCAGRVPPTPEDGYDGAVVLNDPSHQISRRHFEFGMTPMGQVWVMDCDSANGTWLESNGSREQLAKRVRTPMPPGALLRFGSMRAVLREQSAGSGNARVSVPSGVPGAPAKTVVPPRPATPRLPRRSS